MAVKSIGWLVLAGLSLLLLGSLLIGIVSRLLRANREDQQASLAVLPEQEVELRNAGELVLMVEVPRMASDFREFQSEVTKLGTGRVTKLKYAYLTARSTVYGVTTMKVPLGTLYAAHSGRYQVRISGTSPGKDYSSYRVLLSRPYLGRLAFQIVGIVFCGVGIVLSLL